MKKRRTDILVSQGKALIRAMRFSALDADTQTCVNHEMLFFNTRRIAAVAWIVIVIEALNVGNVLFLSSQRLATINNRQYLVMYLVLFIAGVVFLFLRRLLRQSPVLLQRCCVAFALYWVVWHALLSAMDLRRNQNVTVFITGIFSLSVLIKLKPWEALCIIPSSLLLLLIFARNTLESGTAINASIVTAMSLLISCSRYFSTLEELGYRQKMILQTNRRVEEKQKRELLQSQQKALLQYSCTLLFLWNKDENTLTLTNEKRLCPADNEALLSLLQCCEEGNAGTLLLRMEGEAVPCEYRMERTLQLDCDNAPIGAVGRLTPVQKPDEHGESAKRDAGTAK